MKQIKGLDTLRAFAVFFVLIEHSGAWFDTSVLNGRIIKDILIPDGGFGVDLFFVLSGFLISTILLGQRKTIAHTGGLTAIKNFMARRALRIFPIYYLFLFLLLICHYPWVREHVWYCLTYTTNILCYRTNSWNHFSHTWTLCVEEQFYLLWPWLLLFVRDRYLKYIFPAAILTGIISTWYSMVYTGHMAPLLVCNCFDAFGIGGLYAYMRQDEARNARFATMVKVCGWVSLCLYFYWRISSFVFAPHVYGLFLSKTINSVLALGLIMMVVNSRSERVRRYFLENRLLNHIGKVSYGIYLYHYVYNVWRVEIGDWMVRVTAPVPTISTLLKDSHINYWVHIVTIILIATLSYYIIEKPFLSLKRYFKYN